MEVPEDFGVKLRGDQIVVGGRYYLHMPSTHLRPAEVYAKGTVESVVFNQNVGYPGENGTYMISLRDLDRNFAGSHLGTYTIHVPTNDIGMGRATIHEIIPVNTYKGALKNLTNTRKINSNAGSVIGKFLGLRGGRKRRSVKRRSRKYKTRK